MWLFIVLWPIAFVAIWAMFNSVRSSKDEKLIVRSQDWPETTGTVLTSNVSWAHVSVRYEYHVGSHRYEGTYEMNLTPTPPDRSGAAGRAISKEAAQDLNYLPAGRKVIIRYNPSQPQESVFYCAAETDEELKGTPPTDDLSFRSLE